MSESSVVLTTNGGDEDYIACELCREPLHELSVKDRQAHYEAHFNNGDGLEANELDVQLAVGLALQDSSPDSRGPAVPGIRSNNIQQAMSSQKPRENVFWHPACSSLPPSRIITPGIIQILGKALQRPESGGGALCVPLVTHYGTEFWDFGWGCGYRNFLMACSALAAQGTRPEYRELLMDDACGPPGVRNLQAWIEDAWRRGYDVRGAQQLRHQLVGTRKWIGTAELYVAFTSRGIPARLVDFPNNGHAHIALIQWLTAHFMEHSNDLNPDPCESSTAQPNLYITSRMPIVLQHKGHSRTIVGIELTRSGDTNVLIYDPARRPSSTLRKAGLKVHAANFPPLDLDIPHKPNSRHHSPTSAKEFFKRMIKGRSRTQLSEQVSKRVRGGSAEPNDWELAGKGKGHRLGGPATESRKRENPEREANTSIKVDDERGQQGAVVSADVIHGLDLGRVLGAFRVTPLQLSKKDQYQILWFPMTAPLTDPERESCKVVCSERVTVSPAPDP